MLEIGICAIIKPVISLLESENFNSGTFAFATVFSDLSTIIPCKRDWEVAARDGTRHIIGRVSPYGFGRGQHFGWLFHVKLYYFRCVTACCPSIHFNKCVVGHKVGV